MIRSIVSAVQPAFGTLTNLAFALLDVALRHSQQSDPVADL